MDWLLLVLRVAHVGGAMLWFGGAIVGGFFIFPTAKALGPAAGPFMEHLDKRRRMNVYFPIVALVTVLAGAALYWRDSNGLDPEWLASGPGLAFTIGGLAAIVAFVGGMLLIAPSAAAQAAVAKELAAGGGGAPNEGQRARLERADQRLRLAARMDLPLLIVAALTMAVGRYL